MSRHLNARTAAAVLMAGLVLTAPAGAAHAQALAAGAAPAPAPAPTATPAPTAPVPAPVSSLTPTADTLTALTAAATGTAPAPKTLTYILTVATPAPGPVTATARLSVPAGATIARDDAPTPDGGQDTLEANLGTVDFADTLTLPVRITPGPSTPACATITATIITAPVPAAGAHGGDPAQETDQTPAAATSQATANPCLPLTATTPAAQLPDPSADEPEHPGEGADTVHGTLTVTNLTGRHQRLTLTQTWTGASATQQDVDLPAGKTWTQPTDSPAVPVPAAVLTTTVETANGAAADTAAPGAPTDPARLTATAASVTRTVPVALPAATLTTGHLTEGDTTTAHVTVTNTGTAALDAGLLSLTLPGATAPTDLALPGPVKPATSVRVPLTLTPTTHATLAGTLALTYTAATAAQTTGSVSSAVELPVAAAARQQRSTSTPDPQPPTTLRQTTPTPTRTGPAPTRADDDRTLPPVELPTVRPHPKGDTVTRVAARDDVAATPQRAPVSIAVLANDTGATTATLKARPTHGTVTCAADLCQYTPARDFTGTDTFTYTAHGPAGTATATVTVQAGTITTAAPTRQLPRRTATGGTLPRTGADAAALTRLGLGLLLAGAGLTVLRVRLSGRRR